jgi:hypothetical protein
VITGTKWLRLVVASDAAEQLYAKPGQPKQVLLVETHDHVQVVVFA